MYICKVFVFEKYFQILFFDVFVFVFEEFFEKVFILVSIYTYLLIEKTAILNTNSYYFKKIKQCRDLSPFNVN